MIVTTDQHQPQLFAPPPPAEPPTPKPPEDAQSDNPGQPAAETETITTAELLERIFQSMCSFRRFERELLLGASDQELGKIFGHAFCSGRGPIALEFRPEGEPTLIIRDSTFKIEVMTLSATEIAPYVRRIVGIPQPKTEPEKRIALDQQFEDMRAEQRRDILTYIRSLVGEKTPRKKKKGPDEKPSLSQEIAGFLFTRDCFSEASIRRNLIRIARLVAQRANQDTLKATKTAVSIIDQANGRWRSAIGYWQDTDDTTSSYQTAKPKEKNETSPP